MDHEQLQAAADVLLDMRGTKRIEQDLPPGLRPQNLEDAYAVQDLLVDALLPVGAARIGYKVACTSRIAQEALRIDGPLFGQLMSHSSSPTGVTLAADGFVHRVVEAEFGFRIGSDVHGGPHTAASIAAHIDAVVPAIEIVDYRFESWAVGALPVAADNAIHGWWVHGEPVADWTHLDLRSCNVDVGRNGDVVTSGSGAAVLGHPLTVMAWLADELHTRGRQLRAGDLVTTGVTTGVFEAAAGDTIEARSDGLGAVELTMR